MSLLTRDVEGHFRRLATQYCVITIMGPRQAGKSTLCTMVFPDKPYANLEQFETREMALRDPTRFLRQYEGTGVILDEIQNAPDLLSEIQVITDQDPTKKGRGFRTIKN